MIRQYLQKSRINFDAFEQPGVSSFRKDNSWRRVRIQAATIVLVRKPRLGMVKEDGIGGLRLGKDVVCNAAPILIWRVEASFVICKNCVDAENNDEYQSRCREQSRPQAP